jgi:small subunit ribosomal protein S6
MTPVLSEEQMDEAAVKYAKIIKDGGAKIIADERWGLKKLAYPIQKKSTGYYHCIEFNGSGELITGMELALKRDEKIMRFLTVKMDKHAVAWSIKRRKLAKEGKKKEVKEEVATKKEEPIAEPKAEPVNN